MQSVGQMRLSLGKQMMQSLSAQLLSTDFSPGMATSSILGDACQWSQVLVNSVTIERLAQALTTPSHMLGSPFLRLCSLAADTQLRCHGSPVLPLTRQLSLSPNCCKCSCCSRTAGFFMASTRHDCSLSFGHHTVQCWDNLAQPI